MADFISLELILLNTATLAFSLKEIFFSVCRGGYKKVGDQCVLCPVGTFRKFTDPETECKTCLPGTDAETYFQGYCCMYQHHNNKFGVKILH